MFEGMGGRRRTFTLFKHTWSPYFYSFKDINAWIKPEHKSDCRISGGVSGRFRSSRLVIKLLSRFVWLNV